MAGRQEAAGRPWHHPGVRRPAAGVQRVRRHGPLACRAVRDAGFSTEVLEGTLDQRDRDTLQERFLAGDYQVLVSTDAGGEGIDLQSANVMVDWDIPWSLVRLSSGQVGCTASARPARAHLPPVAPQTREGRVQQVMLDNLTAAARALRGRIYDLLDATADRAGFDYAAAMAATQRDPDAVEAIAAGCPTPRSWSPGRRSSPRKTARKARSTPGRRWNASPPTGCRPSTRSSWPRSSSRSPARPSGRLTSGPAAGIKPCALDGLPAGVASGSECLVAADGASVAKACSEGFQRSADVVVLGPTEEPFQALVEHATRTCEADLVRGAAAVDLASLTGYTLFVYAADLEHHDGCTEPAGRSRSWCATPALARFRWRGSRS